MSTVNTAPAAARPDLSTLLTRKPETVAHLILAEIGGATWAVVERLHSEPFHELRFGNTPTLRLFPEGHTFAFDNFPRPLDDDGDAWRLMVREGLSIRPTGPTWWQAEWMKDDGWCGYSKGPGPRRQAAVAALHKHALDPHWSDIIPSVIERLEQAR